jgi:hypothetical protein
MAYNQNIPAASDLISQSQSDIQANFQAIQTLLTINHGIFGAVDEGKHKHVSFPNQAASPTTTATEVALFSRSSSLSGASELCLRRQADGTVYEFTSSTAAASGWTRLPSGILLKWGSSATVGGAETISFPVAASVPAFSSIFQVLISTNVAGASDTFVLLNSFTINDITVTSTARTTTANAVSGFSYLAIGL